MQRYWIDGREVELTPRQELRLALRAGWSMDAADGYRRTSTMSAAAHQRFTRLWAVSTATEHPYTAAWSLARWRSRRDRVCRAVRACIAASKAA